MSARSVTRGLPILLSLAFLAFGLLVASGGLARPSATGSPPTGVTGMSGVSSGMGGMAMSGGGMGGSSMTTTAPGSTSSGPRAAVLLSYSIVGSDEGNLVPDGMRHDTFMATNPMPIRAGEPVTITIQNRDEMPHSMTSPELGLNIIVPAAKDGAPGTVDFTFTPPRPGTYRWYCAIPCDGDGQAWAMTSSARGPGQEGFMAGTITVQ